MILAWNVSRVDNLEGFNRASNIRLGGGLYGIPDAGISDRGVGMGLGDRLLVQGSHTGNVDFVAYEIIPIQRLIILVPELEKHRLPPP